MFHICLNVESDPLSFSDAIKKLKIDETIDKLKVLLVAQGFRQKQAIDHFDTYALVERTNIIRLLDL